VLLRLPDLGFSPAALAAVEDVLRRGDGLVLVAGPTGAGKTTTVYAMLKSLGGSDRNMVSIEDPVEFDTPFIRQLNVDERHGITMTKGLITILRMDPDVIFVGEIRDSQAADIAIRAASSGKFVLSTLHTRDVASAITTLRDLQLSDRSLSANLSCIVSQRLIRRLCAECRRQVQVDNAQRQLFADHGVAVPQALYEHVGCDACRGTGYRGRLGVFEALAVTREVAKAIALGKSEDALRDDFRETGLVTLQTDMLEKVAAGITDLHEASAVHWVA
jgi:type II secretory ATPase GspE/PulE/Tfp pilus assembly ATPase PilB-like protein